MAMGLRNYWVVTAGYWGFTITDGAIRMLVVLYFHQLGYTPFEIAMLFLFYELFGVVTNLVGGWLGARIGLNLTMHIGMGLQIVALSMLAVPAEWLSVAYVMLAQALSGIAKDLNKMSAKSCIKLVLPEHAQGRLFKWVAVLTGSKNSLKGAGFFIGGLLLAVVGFQGALTMLAGGLFVVLMVTALMLPNDMGKTQAKAKFTQVFSKSRDINWLSAARFFLFGARDVWFVVGLPVYCSAVLGWSVAQIGAFFALWVIGYGAVQASAPKLLRHGDDSAGPDGAAALRWAVALALVPAVMVALLMWGVAPGPVVVIGLAIFGVVFAINSAVHSFLILVYADHDRVSMDVGFYYMANAGGRLIGTVLSGGVYQLWGLAGCLWCSVVFLIAASVLSTRLSRTAAIKRTTLAS